MTWVVTGGAGYIGAHVVHAMREAGTAVVVLDDLSSGHRAFVPDDTALEVLKLVDGARSVGAIADTLAERFAAPREVIEADITEMLRDLAERGVVAVA